MCPKKISLDKYRIHRKLKKWCLWIKLIIFIYLYFQNWNITCTLEFVADGSILYSKVCFRLSQQSSASKAGEVNNSFMIKKIAFLFHKTTYWEYILFSSIATNRSKILLHEDLIAPWVHAGENWFLQEVGISCLREVHYPLYLKW